jgi:uncharacterized membrane protein
MKTIGYRVISWVSTTALAWFILGSQVVSSEGSSMTLAEATLLFSGVDMIANTILYFLYERAWIRHNK